MVLHTWGPNVERGGSEVSDGEEVGSGVEGEGGGRGAVGGGHARQRFSSVRLPRHHAAVLAARHQHGAAWTQAKSTLNSESYKN